MRRASQKPRSNPLWIAQRHGQDWRDELVLGAIAWLTSFVPATAWTERMEGVRRTFAAARSSWAEGETVALFNPSDSIAWYVFQANAYAADRADWFEPEAFRIAPVFRRIGQVLDDLRQVYGIEERVARLMIGGRRNPDEGLFELLVAAAYKRRDWGHVGFIPEQPGRARTPDIEVQRGRTRRLIECKRVNRSGYEADEKLAGERLAGAVHELCRERGRSVVVEVAFDVELGSLHSGYLLDRVSAYLGDPGLATWADDGGRGMIHDVDWNLPHTVLQSDDVFYGSSRMIELLAGGYTPTADHSMAADWAPAEGRPLFAAWVNQASVVSWISRSRQAARRKARHFRSIVADAAGQISGGSIGVVHVGYEARDGNSVDALRHLLNAIEMNSFEPRDCGLRWVYGNYLSPEHVNARHESAALSETTAKYRIGGNRTPDPLPDHLLFSDGEGAPGAHWFK